MEELKSDEVLFKKVDIVEDWTIFEGMARFVASCTRSCRIERLMVGDCANVAIASVTEEFEPVWNWDTVGIGLVKGDVIKGNGVNRFGFVLLRHFGPGRWRSPTRLRPRAMNIFSLMIRLHRLY